MLCAQWFLSFVSPVHSKIQFIVMADVQICWDLGSCLALNSTLVVLGDCSCILVLAFMCKPTKDWSRWKLFFNVKVVVRLTVGMLPNATSMTVFLLPTFACARVCVYVLFSLQLFVFAYTPVCIYLYIHTPDLPVVMMPTCV